MLGATLREQGLEQFLADPCIFRPMDDEDGRMALAVHVNDVIVVGTNKNCAGIWNALFIGSKQEGC